MAPFPCRSARPTHLQNLRSWEGWRTALTGRWIDRSQQVTATPGRLQRVGSRLPWHSSPCWGPSIVHVYSVSLSAFHPLWVHHQSIFHQGFPIEADGISHFLSPGRRRPSDSVGRGRISGDWNHSSQSGRGNRGATQPRNTSAASLTQQQGVPLCLSPNHVGKPSRDLLETPSSGQTHAAKQSTKGQDIAPPSRHSTRFAQIGRHLNRTQVTGKPAPCDIRIRLLSHHTTAPPPASRRTTSCRP